MACCQLFSEHRNRFHPPQQYAPFFANSGFYFVRHNQRTEYFVQQAMTSFDVIMSWRSQQHMLNMLLAEHRSAFGLGVQMLDIYQFPLGKLFHHDAEWFNRLAAGTVHPYIFHWSWTAGKEEKLRYAKQTGMWYLSERCGSVHLASEVLKMSHKELKGCCQLHLARQVNLTANLNKPLPKRQVKANAAARKKRSGIAGILH